MIAMKYRFMIAILIVTVTAVVVTMYILIGLLVSRTQPYVLLYIMELIKNDLHVIKENLLRPFRFVQGVKK